MRKFFAVSLGLLLLVSAGCKRIITPVPTPVAASATKPMKPARAPAGDPATRVARNTEIVKNAGLPTPEVPIVKYEYWFVITDKSLAALKQQGVPEALVTKLEKWNGTQFQTAEQLEAGLKTSKSLTEEEWNRIKDPLMKTSRVDLKIRSPRDAAQKTLAWSVVAYKANKFGQIRSHPLNQQPPERKEVKNAIYKFIDNANLKDQLGYRERSFLFDIKPLVQEDKENANFDWRYERVWVMLWALGHLKTFGTPAQACSVENIGKIMPTPGQPPEQLQPFIENARLRSRGEILDKYDLVRRYLAGIYEAKKQNMDMTGKPNEEIAKEWYIALSWLVGDKDPEDYVVTSQPPKIRRGQSEAILKHNNIPVVTDLPILDFDDTTLQLRSPEEVANRALVLFVVSVRAQALQKNNPLTAEEDAELQKALNNLKLNGSLTPRESAFLQTKSPSPKEIADFKNRFECFWLLLWALGYIEPLDMPLKEDPAAFQTRVWRAQEIMIELTGDRFRKFARLRSPAEILDKADLMYRLVYAGVDANVKKRPMPGDLDLEVAWQWHYTLHWLIRKNNEDWDHVKPAG